MDCGGCRGKGRHARWCEKVVGIHASQLGRMSELAEGIGDRVGANNTKAANLAYALSGELRRDADARAAEYMERYGTRH